MQREKSENLWTNIGETEHVKRAGSNNAQEVRANEFENEQGDNFMNVQGEKSGHCVKFDKKLTKEEKQTEHDRLLPTQPSSNVSGADGNFNPDGHGFSPSSVCGLHGL